MARPMLSRQRQAWRRPDTQASTWALLPSEAAKRPSVVRVTNPAGQLIATIDAITRRRVNTAGHLEATLTPQGWNLELSAHSPPTAIAPRRPHPTYSAPLRGDRGPRGERC